MNKQNVSPSLLDRIKQSEGFRSTAYPDGMSSGKQLYSIGYGHQIRPNESFLKNEVISKQFASELLLKDILPLEQAVNSSLKPLNQAQFDELVDFGYNTGIGALNKVINTLNNSTDFKNVADHINQYVKFHDSKNNLVTSAALVARRKINSLPFLNQPKIQNSAIVAVLISLFAVYLLA